MDIITLIVEVLIAIGALGALYYARRAFQQTKEFKEEERESRRAYLAPSSEPGHIPIGTGLFDSNYLVINLVNFGINPIDKIEAEILSFNEADIRGINKEITPQLNLQCFAFNPIPHNAPWTVKLSGGTLISAGVTDISLVASDYVIMRVNYRDRILNKDYTDTFYWKSDEDGLAEVEPASLKKLKSFISEEEEFWETVRLKRKDSDANSA